MHCGCIAAAGVLRHATVVRHVSCRAIRWGTLEGVTLLHNHARKILHQHATTSASETTTACLSAPPPPASASARQHLLPGPHVHVASGMHHTHTRTYAYRASRVAEGVRKRLGLGAPLRGGGLGKGL
jgi:hypothetical protein